MRTLMERLPVREDGLYSRLSTTMYRVYKLDSVRSSKSVRPEVQISCYGSDMELQRVALSDLAEIRRKMEGQFFWIDICSPTRLDMEHACSVFGLHLFSPSDLEDASSERFQLMPKYWFIVLNYTREDEEQLPLAIILFQNCFLTMHTEPLPFHEQVVQELHRLTCKEMEPSWVLFSIFNAILLRLRVLVDRMNKKVVTLTEFVLEFGPGEASDFLRRIRQRPRDAHRTAEDLSAETRHPQGAPFVEQRSWRGRPLH